MMSESDKYDAAFGRILELVVLLNDDMAQRFARDGLTRSRTHLLWEVLQRGPSTQRDLAEAMGTSARTITGLVDGLVATGFVTREPHPTDRRATLVTFTDHGAATMEVMGREQQEIGQLLFGAMPAERFDCFVAGLDEVLARLREQGLSHEIQEDGA